MTASTRIRPIDYSGHMPDEPDASGLDAVFQEAMVRTSEQPGRVRWCWKPQCQNPALTMFGLCMSHLHEAAAEWARVVGLVVEHKPGAIYDATATERGLK